MFVFPQRATRSVGPRTQNILTLTIPLYIHPSFVNCPSGSLEVLESGAGQRYTRTTAQPSFTLASGALSSLHSTLKPPAMRQLCSLILPQLPHQRQIQPKKILGNRTKTLKLLHKFGKLLQEEMLRVDLWLQCDEVNLQRTEKLP